MTGIIWYHLYRCRNHRICAFIWETLQFSMFQLRTMPFGADLGCKTYIWDKQYFASGAPSGPSLCSVSPLLPLCWHKAAQSSPMVKPILSNCSSWHYRILQFFLAPFSPSNLAISFPNFSGTWWQMRELYSIQRWNVNVLCPPKSRFIANRGPWQGLSSQNSLLVEFQETWQYGGKTVKECLSAYSSKGHFISQDGLGCK